MKGRLLFLVSLLLLITVGRATAQTLTTLYGFTGTTDGANPQAGLILSGNTLYGTASGGGTAGNGTVFAVNTDGTGFTVLHSFTYNTDGANPYAGLILSGNTLYGTAANGSPEGIGAVFAVNTDGTGFTVLHSFIFAADGGNPNAGLILSGNTLYGTATNFGTKAGTVFKVNTDGTGFAPLHSFNGTDGGYPYAGLILLGNTLYGTTAIAGPSNGGTVFAVNTDGTGFATLHGFGPTEGFNPRAGLILSGNTLYGTTAFGGTSGDGTVFAVNTDGTGYTTLYNFHGTTDGSDPHAGLILSGNTLYGTTSSGGTSNAGTVFAVNTDGTGFTTLHSFAGGTTDGANPDAGLILSGNILYGTTFYGGTSGYGTVFSLSLAGAQSAFSRKVHGGAGTFDIPLPLTGNVGVECRTGPTYQMIINFAIAVTVDSVTVTAGNGNVGNFSGNGTPTITVNLSGVTNAQRITVTLHNVHDGVRTSDVPVSMGVLVGDSNGNGTVNAADVAQTKSRLGQTVGAANFRSDVNANGSINAGDAAIVKQNSGTSLPP